MDTQDFIDLGGKKWEKNGMHRVYINADIFNKLMQTAFGDNNNKFFFDSSTKELMRSYKEKKPICEKKF